MQEFKYFGYNNGEFIVVAESKAAADDQAIRLEEAAGVGAWPQLEDEFGNQIIPPVRIATVAETQAQWPR